MSDTGSLAGKRKLLVSRAQRPALSDRSASTGSIRSSNGSASGHTSASTKQPFLVLLPLNDTFEPKCIQLPALPEVMRIGRQTNKATLPHRENGFFDSKVLSRAHAEVWADTRGRVCIKDIRSSNGTFINDARLSKENEESEVKELNLGDTLELGIDILNDETGMIVHRKVSARVDFAGIPHETPNFALASGSHGNGNGMTQERGYGDTRLASRGNVGASVFGNGHGGAFDFGSASASNHGMSSLGTSADAHHPLASFGRQSITFETVVKKLAHDLQLSKRVSADLKSTSDTFSRVAGARYAQQQQQQQRRHRQQSGSPFSGRAPTDLDTSHAQESAALSTQLAQTREALDAQAARVQSLEMLLEQERDARMTAEMAVLDASNVAEPMPTALTTEHLIAHDVADALDADADAVAVSCNSRDVNIDDTQSEATMHAKSDPTTFVASSSSPLREQIKALTAQLLERDRQYAAERVRADAAEQQARDAQQDAHRLASQLEASETRCARLTERLADLTAERAESATGTLPKQQRDQASALAKVNLRAASGTAFVSALGVVVLGLSVMGLLNEYAVKDS